MCGGGFRRHDDGGGSITGSYWAETRNVGYCVLSQHKKEWFCILYDFLIIMPDIHKYGDYF